VLGFALALTALLRPVAIEGAARCPSADAVAHALSSLLPDAKIERADDALHVRVDDLGARWRLTVGDSRRELPDGARRCEERARQAAVVVALALAPPTVDAAETEPTPELAAPPTVEAAAPPPSEIEVRAPIEERPRPPAVSHRIFSLELGARLDMAPDADGGALAQGGVALRAALGRGRFAGALGIAAVTPSTMSLMPSTVHMTRIPIDLSLRFVAHAGPRADTVFDVGAVAHVLLLEGAVGMGGNRVDIGARAAATERFWLSDDTAFFASAEASFLPRTYALVIDEGGQSVAEGHTPDLWLGLTMGFALRWQ